MEHILGVLFVFIIIGALLLTIHSILSAKRLTRFTLVSMLLLGVIAISFGLPGLFCLPSSRSCFAAYSLLVFLFFGIALAVFIMRRWDKWHSLSGVHMPE